MATVPATARDFELAGKFVIQDCPGCMKRSRIDPGVISLTFGDDFDVLRGTREIRRRLGCPNCGASRPDVYFGDAEHPLVQIEDVRKTA